MATLCELSSPAPPWENSLNTLFNVFVSLLKIFYFRRNSDNFYRTYISTDENRHLTKGNDGFEPLDDSDID